MPAIIKTLARRRRRLRPPPQRSAPQRPHPQPARGARARRGHPRGDGVPGRGVRGRARPRRAGPPARAPRSAAGLPLWFVCTVVDAIADALESAHQTGVLHRDVKPSNIFGSPQTGMRLGDFGIATALGVKVERSEGTLRFLAPEAASTTRPRRGGGTYCWAPPPTTSTTGHPPFADLAQILAGSPAPFPPARRPEEGLLSRHVLARMLERDPRAAHASSWSRTRRRLARAAGAVDAASGSRGRGAGPRRAPVRVTGVGALPPRRRDHGAGRRHRQQRQRRDVDALRGGRGAAPPRRGLAIEEEAQRQRAARPRRLHRHRQRCAGLQEGPPRRERLEAGVVHRPGQPARAAAGRGAGAALAGLPRAGYRQGAGGARVERLRHRQRALLARAARRHRASARWSSSSSRRRRWRSTSRSCPAWPSPADVEHQEDEEDGDWCRRATWRSSRPWTSAR